MSFDSYIICLTSDLTNSSFLHHTSYIKMNYIIHTPSAVRLKKEILESVSNNADANGKTIATWHCVETEANDRVLVHTTDQWEEKGYITLKQNKSHNELKVRFHYWDSCEDRSNDDDRYMLGRFTELLLVHFSYFIDKIVIE